MFQVASARGPELARQAPVSAGRRQRVMLSQLVIKQVWGEHSFNKSQLAAYLTHVRKPAPAESRLRSHQARFGGKPTPVAPSSLRQQSDSGRTKPTLVARSGRKLNSGNGDNPRKFNPWGADRE